MRISTFFIIALFAGLFIMFESSNSAAQTRIRFARGRTSASLSGSLSPGATRSYVLGARRGQELSGNVSSRSDCVKFTEGSTSLGFTTSNGDNRISVTNYCRASASYTMTVSINY